MVSENCLHLATFSYLCQSPSPTSRQSQLIRQMCQRCRCPSQACDEHVRSFAHKPLRRRKADAAIGAGNQRDFPSSLPIWFSLVVISLAVLCERRRSALPSPRAHPNDREQQSLSEGRRAACVGAPSPTSRASHLDSSASACSQSFFPACRNSSLSLVPATARDNDSAPYIRAIKPIAFSRPLAPASSISASKTVSTNFGERWRTVRVL
jgi:hypothetical protein